MNKATKGALAAAAAAAILAGGAGTMAAWTANTGTGDSTTVTAGSMNVVQTPNTGTWTWTVNDAEVPFNPQSDKIVPGDVIKYTASYDVTLEGTNLKAKLKPTLGGISGDLQDLLTVDTTGGSTVDVTQSATYPVSTTITFNGDATTGQTKSGSLAGATVTLEQVIS